MKIRTDYVTNSSSSSFICDICGRIESGWDICLSDAEMVECEYGHVMCEDEIDFYMIRKEFFLDVIKEKADDGDEEAIKIYKRIQRAEEIENNDEVCSIFEYYEDDYIEEYDVRYNLPKKYCPLCNHDVVTERDFIKYVSMTTGKSYEQLMEEARQYYKKQ